MKVLFYGDIHTNFDFPDYMGFLDKTLGFLLQTIYAHQPKYVINLGDVTDTFGTVELRSLVWAYDWMQKIGRAAKECGGKHHIIQGNHDVDDKDCTISSVQVMQSANTQVHITASKQDEVLFLPFGTEAETARHLCHSRGPETAQDALLVAGHIEWRACQLTSSFVSKTGLDTSEPTLPVFNGHFHSPANVGKVHFVGSPLYKNFNDFETEIPRGFTLYDTDTKVVTRIENHHTYRMASIQAETESELEAQLSKITDMGHTKIRFMVPKALLEIVESLRSEFLWCSVHRSDFEKTDVNKATGITIVSDKDTVVKTVVESAPKEFSRELLTTYGSKAFA